MGAWVRKMDCLSFSRVLWLFALRLERRNQSSIALTARLRPIVATDGFRTFIEKTGSIAESTTPDELRGMLKQTAAEAGALIDEFKMQIE
jgi:hypothetical protein